MKTPLNTFPLIRDYRPTAAYLSTPAGWLDQQSFLACAQAFAKRLPTANFVINLCESRDTFLLGFATALLRGQTTLLPPNRSEETVARIRAAYAGSYVLKDTGAADAVAVPALINTPVSIAQVPRIPAQQLAAITFTSGTTGTPLAYARTWESLFVHGNTLCEQLGFRGRTIVATVPPQHTYGLETTVMSALAGGAAIHRGRPFFPQDIGEALATASAPRVLVTTPIHLKALVQARHNMPAIERVVSATAPLATDLASRAEQLLQAPVHEVYGSTETGALATRRTVADELWQPLPGVVLVDDGLGTVAHAPHLPTPFTLTDILEVGTDGRFRLIGRRGDMLKVAGKRASLAELSQHLLAIPGIEDAVVFVPQSKASTTLEARPAALVVAPSLSVEQILESLARCIDPVFLPRPLRRVARLPRNELGKLAQTALQELLQP